jgi:outer membrane biosynthesis protein TonB
MSTFDQDKNLKASTYTILLVGGLLIISFLISWAPPPPIEIPVEEGMEVNLGNSEMGAGDIQPLLPDEPVDLIEEVKPSPPQAAAQEAPVKDIETNDEDLEAPPAVVKKPVEKPKKKPEVKPTPEIPKPVTKPKPEAKPVETPPAPPKPKFIYKGQSGNTSGQGGNNADTYQPSNGQGIAGGKGDQGKPNGSADSDSYTGNGGSGSGGSGISISRGLQGRRISSRPSFEEDFNENAKIAVDIKIDASGKVVSVAIQPRGTTTGNTSMKAIALQKARQLKFTPDENAPDVQLGTIVFNFRIKG